MKRTLASLSLLLLGSTVAHAIPPLITTAGPDRTPGGTARSLAASDQDQVALAYGANQYLAVWRDGPVGAKGIMAARLQLDGSAIDDPPVLLAAPAAAGFDAPTVAFDGASFLVVWRDAGANQLEGRYLSPAGALGALAFELPLADPRPALAGGGAKTLLVYSKINGAESTINGRLADPGGVPGAEFEIAKSLVGSQRVRKPAVTAGPDGFVVAWEHQGTGAAVNIEAALVTTGAAVTALGQLNTAPQTTDRSGISLAFGDSNLLDANPGQYLVAWGDSRATPRRIWGAVLASPPVALVTPGATEFQLEPGVATFSSQRPQVGYIDGEFLVVWEKVDSGGQSSVLQGQRLIAPNTLDGAVTELIGSTPRSPSLLPNTSRPSALASAGATGLLAWSGAQNISLGASYLDARVLPIPAGALAATGVSLGAAKGPHAERSVEVGSNGAGFLAVWEDTRDLETQRGTEIYMQRYDAEGTPIGAAQPLLAAVGDQRYPAVAGLPGGDYLVAWMDMRNDPPAQATARPSCYDFSVTDPGSACDVSYRLHVARVGADGTVRDAGGTPVIDALRPRDARDRFPRVTIDPVHQRWLVTWEHGDIASLNTPTVYAVVIDSDGAQRPTQVLSYNGAPPQLTTCAAAATWTGNGYLVVAEAECASHVTLTGTNAQRSFFPTQLIGFRLDADGVPETTRLSLTSDTMRESLAPTIAATGLDPKAPTGVIIAWESHPKMGLGSISPETQLRGLIGPPTGTLAAVTLMKASAGTDPTLKWPRLVSSGTGYAMSVIDHTDKATTGSLVRALRIDAAGAVLAADTLEVPRGAGLSVSTLVEPLPLRAVTEVVPALPEPLPGALAQGGEGQLLLAYTTAEPAPIGRAHTRLLNGRAMGERCDRTAGGLGCGEGFCARDPEHADQGLCCNTSCSNPCQRCTIDGCVGVPAADSACGMVSCQALSTECRSYNTAPGACLGSGVCARSDDLSSCSAANSITINEGGRCSAIGCTSAGACQAGDCICPDAARVLAERTLLDGCSVGAVGGTARTPSAALFLVLGMFALLALRSRGRWPALLLLLGLTAGCTDKGVLGIDLKLDDETGRQTAILRLIIEQQDPTQGFAASAPTGSGRDDVLIRNVDIDGDGVVEIVADLQPSFPVLRSTTYLALQPSAAGPLDVLVRAIALDRYGNPIATTTGNARLPGDTITLELACGASGCTGASARDFTATAAEVDAQAAVTAISARAFGPQRLVAVGAATFDQPPLAANMEPGPIPVLIPRAGKVTLYVPRDATSLLPGLTLVGGGQTEFFGSALALGTVTRADGLDLVVGAPGANAGAGRVYVVSVPADLSTPHIFLVTDPSLNVRIYEGRPGDQLGSSLALVDLDGDGREEIIAGAPGDDVGEGRGRVYVLSNAQLPIAETPHVIGATLHGHLGRSLASHGSLIAAGAPGANTAVLFDAKTEPTVAGATSVRAYTASAGGALGTAVALSDLDADGAVELLASAPGGAGRVQAMTAPTELRALSEGDVRHVVRGQDALGQLGQLGAAMVGLHTPAGEALLVTSYPETNGMAYVLRGSALTVAGPSLPLSSTGPASAAVLSVQALQFTALAAADVLDAPGLELFLGNNRGGFYITSLGITP